MSESAILFVATMQIIKLVIDSTGDLSEKVSNLMTLFRSISLKLGIFVLVLSVFSCGEDNAASNSTRATTPEISSNSDLTSSQIAPQTRAVGFSGTQNQLDTPNAGIWVSGQGTVSLKPDLALLDVEVEADAKTVSKALEIAAIAMNGIIDSLNTRGIGGTDVQTQHFNIHTRYEWPEPGKQVLVGYVVSNGVAVKIRDLDAVGEIIDEITIAGGDSTRINNIGFTVEDQTPYAAELRELAVNDALTKARHYADLAGVTLGSMLSITESGGGNLIERDFGSGSFAMARSAAVPPTNISSGELELKLNIQAVFQIQ